MKPTLKNYVKAAKKHLEAGDSTRALAKIGDALLQSMTQYDRHLMAKAYEEARIGSPEKAETLLKIVTFKPGGSKGHPPKYCDNPSCEAEASRKVKVSVNTPGDQTRNYCEGCYGVYWAGAQHIKKSVADALAKEIQRL